MGPLTHDAGYDRSWPQARQRDNKGVGRTAAVFADMKTWTERLGHSGLRCFTDADHHFWLEQNPAKNSKWAKLAREGHEMAWEFASPGGAYTGRLLIDGEIYKTSEATKKFLKTTA
jgi:hypothetical protein